MSPMSLPKMFVSESAGWIDLAVLHPRVVRMLVRYVMPMSLLPPLMYAYIELVQPGVISPPLEPPMSAMEAMVIGVAFFAAEIAAVALMAGFILQLGENRGLQLDSVSAYALAAVAPTPLWLAPLALFIPSLGLNMAVLVLAWLGSVALIRHGIRPLLGVADPVQARGMANTLIVAGVASWIALLMVLVMTVSLVLGWR